MATAATASVALRSPPTMGVEITVICIDDSQSMRNAPTRFQAQADAAKLICLSKTKCNPENMVGIITMAGKHQGCVLLSLTNDLSKMLASIDGLQIHGDAEINLAASIYRAHVLMRIWCSEDQQKRIIVFAGSPVNDKKKSLKWSGNHLKENSVALDIVSFGEEDEGKTEKLEALLAAINNNDTSHFVSVSAGSNAISDVLLSTHIVTADGEGGSGFAAAGAAAVAPNLDPDLALATRVSMEAAAKKAAEESSKQEKQASLQDAAAMTEPCIASAFEAEIRTHNLMDDDNAILQPMQAFAVADTESSSGTTLVANTEFTRHHISCEHTEFRRHHCARHTRNTTTG